MKVDASSNRASSAHARAPPKSRRGVRDAFGGIVASLVDGVLVVDVDVSGSAERKRHDSSRVKVFLTVTLKFDINTRTVSRVYSTVALGVFNLLKAFRLEINAKSVYDQFVAFEIVKTVFTIALLRLWPRPRLRLAGGSRCWCQRWQLPSHLF